MTSERVLDVSVHRHVFDTDRPFGRVLDGIFGGISQPDITQLFSKLARSGTYQEFSSLVEQAQGSAGVRGRGATRHRGARAAACGNWSPGSARRLSAVMCLTGVSADDKRAFCSGTLFAGLPG
jgi:hypothetical protein